MRRRQFLGGSAAGLAAAFLPVRTFRAQATPAPGDAQPAGTLLRHSERPTNYESVRATFTERITPLDRFFLRNHFDAPVAHPGKISLRGLVDKPRDLAIADLEKLPQVTVEAVLQCAGNGRGLFSPRVPGVQWRLGAMGNAEWTGVRLADVLGKVGPSAKHIQFHGAEKPVLPSTPPFIRGIPIAKALHPDTLIALRMNGKPLSLLHGAPARLVVPGWVGDDWMKWLTDIEVIADEPKGFFYETGYRIPITPGEPGKPVPADQMTPMTKLSVKSLIGSIEHGGTLAPGRRELVGVAFSGEARIAKVDVTIDGGKSWSPATLDAHDSAYGFRVFRYSFDAAPGTLIIGSRATDAAGATQPTKAVWNPAGYLHNAIDLATVEVHA